MQVILFQVLARGYETTYDYIALTEEQMASDKASGSTNYLNNIAARLKGKRNSCWSLRESFGVDMEIWQGCRRDYQNLQMRPKVDAVAMTTHGRSALGRWVFGSVAERIFRKDILLFCWCDLPN